MRLKEYGRFAFGALFLLLILVPWMMARTLADCVPDTIGVSGFCPLLGDSLVPLLMMTAAFFFSSRVLAAGAVLTGWITLGLKTAVLLLYQKAFMPFNWRSIKMIWCHTDHTALLAVLGPHYLWWLIPLILLLMALIAGSCILAWKIPQNDFPHRKKYFYGVMLLTAVSLAANICHIIDSSFDTQAIYSGHLVTPLPAVIVEEISKSFRPARKIKQISAESRASLIQLKMISPEPPYQAAARFDRIIIIAVESLDLAYLGSCNPQMPQGITPELDQLLQAYPHYVNYFAAAQPTSWGLNALLLSRPDFELDSKSSELPSLFSETAKLGFKSYYFAPTSGLFGDNRKLYQELFKAQKQYFAEDWKRHFNLQANFRWGIADEELFDGVLKVLRKDNPQKFIALISTIDLHPGYTAYGKAANDPRFVHEPFLNALHSTDRNLGDFVRAVMEDKSLYNERTLIVITADHSATHGRNYLKRTDYCPDRIPLIFITPQAEIFRKIPADQYASSIDLAPTLLHLTGAKIPPSMMGCDLFESKNIAVSRTMTDVLLINAPAFHCVVDLNKKMPKKQPERAFYEWYRFHY